MITPYEEYDPECRVRYCRCREGARMCSCLEDPDVWSWKPIQFHQAID